MIRRGYCGTASATPDFRKGHIGVVEWAGRMLRETPDEGYAGCCEAIRDADLRGKIGGIQAPTLVIAGADDPAAPPDQAELIQDSISDARLVAIPQSAHLANVEQPESFTRAVLDHLDPTKERTNR